MLCFIIRPSLFTEGHPPAPFALSSAADFESRINHLGNALGTVYENPNDAASIPHQNDASRFVWVIPTRDNDNTENCVLRIRYNIS